VRIARRHLLASSLVLLVAACREPAPDRPTPVPAPLVPEFSRWSREAMAIVSDGIETLRTFEDFHAFRVSTAAQSDRRLPSELVWDAPTSAAWEEATHVARGLHGRADQLFQAVTRATVDPSAWRQQRSMADTVHVMLDFGDTLLEYRNRVELLPPGDASGALPLLDKAWAQWEDVAGRLGVSRAELLSCS